MDGRARPAEGALNAVSPLDSPYRAGAELPTEAFADDSPSRAARRVANGISQVGDSARLSCLFLFVLRAEIRAESSPCGPEQLSAEAFAAEDEMLRPSGAAALARSAIAFTTRVSPIPHRSHAGGCPRHSLRLPFYRRWLAHLRGQ